MKKLLLFCFLLVPFFMNGQTIASQDFEASPATPTLTYVASGTGGSLQTGTTTASERPASTNKFFDGSSSYGVINGDNTITFGPVNASSFSNINFSFRLASFSLNTNGNGADGGDIVEVSISQDGVTYSKELSIAGNTNACWNFTGTGVATAVYDGNNVATPFAPAGGGFITNGFGNPSVTGLPSSSTLYVRVRFLNNSLNEAWYIDQAKLEGTVNSSPNLSVTPSSINGLNYLENSGPSSATSYNLSGVNLTPASGNITITAPTNFELSTTANGTFTDNLLVAYTGSALAITPIFVRLKSGLVAGNYGGTGSNVTNAGGSATTVNVTVSGSVTNGSACGVSTDIATVRAIVPPVASNTGGTTNYTVTGTITAVFGVSKFYVQDATGGIAVFSTNVVSNNGLVVGDQVTLSGIPVRFNGEAQLNGPITATTPTLTRGPIPCISKISTGTTPAPIVFDSNNPPSGIDLNTFLATNEGELIKIISANIASAGTFVTSTNYTVITCNAQGGTEIRVDGGSGTLIGSTIPNITQDVAGVIGRFINATGTDKLQLFPRNAADLSNSATTCTVSGGCGVTAFTDSPTQLDVFNWNIEWLGHPSNGPSQSGTNDATQIANAQTVLNGVGADVYMLQEICQYNATNPSDNTTAFGKLIQGLNNTFGVNAYSGECSAAVSGSVVDANPQRVCIIYKNSVVTKVFSRPMFNGFTPTTYPPTGTPSQFWASGRKPFMFMAKVNVNNQSDTILFVGLHAKAGSAIADYNRRKYDVRVMYDTLQAQYPTRKTVVLGDLNDDVDRSIASSAANGNVISSYAPFLYINPNETVITGTRPNADWNPISKTLSDASCASTVSFPDYIDHQIISNEMSGTTGSGFKYAAASVTSFRPIVANYATTTSDHYATIARYQYLTATPATITSITTGNWSSASTWDCGCVPTSASNVVINPGNTVTVNVAARAKTLNVKGLLNWTSSFTLSLGQ